MDFPQPGVKFTWIKQGSEPNGSGGDQYTGWDRFGRAIDIRWIKNSTGNHLERIQHGYDRASNRLYRANLVAPSSAAQDELYAYDSLYQLKDFQRGVLNSGRTAITGTPAAQETFTFDPTGNWNTYVVNGGGTLNQTRTHNKANELTQINGSGSVVSEDAAGNMTRVPKPADWSQAYDLTYDAWNRLVKVMDGASTVATYGYDGLYRRLTKTIGSNTRHFYYSKYWRVVEERLNGNTAPDRQFVWGTRYSDDLVLRDRDTNSNGTLDQRLYAIQDYFQPTAVMDTSGAVQERYSYEAFGTSRVMTPSYGSRTSSSYEWETRFGAYRWDEETGLHQVRYRSLHPNLGRWSSRDPVAESEDLNLYRYVHNSPENFVDPYGLAVFLGLPQWVEVTVQPAIRIAPPANNIIRLFPPESVTPPTFSPPVPLMPPSMGGPQPFHPIPKPPETHPEGSPLDEYPPLNDEATAPEQCPNKCTPERLAELTSQVLKDCKQHKKKYSCSCWRPPTLGGDTLREMHEIAHRLRLCINARTRRERECWEGGNRTHIQELNGFKKALKNCEKCINQNTPRVDPRQFA